MNLSALPKQLGRLLAPTICVACGDVTPGTQLCSDCDSQLRRIQAPFCQCCGLPLPDAPDPQALCSTCRKRLPKLERARSVVFYTDFASRLIHELKFGRKAYVARALAEGSRALFEAELAELEALPEPVLVVPLPLHWRRFWHRGFNQAGLLARYALPKHKQLLQCRALVRFRPTTALAQLPASERPKAISGAFRARPQLVKGASVLLIDDLMTTGSTLNEAAKALLKAGAVRVRACTFARTPLHY